MLLGFGQAHRELTLNSDALVTISLLVSELLVVMSFEMLNKYLTIEPRTLELRSHCAIKFYDIKTYLHVQRVMACRVPKILNKSNNKTKVLKSYWLRCKHTCIIF